MKQLVVRRFKEKVAVDHVDLSIDAGRRSPTSARTAPVSRPPSKLLSGILVPTSGEVRIGGIVPHLDRMANARRIGVLFGQRTQLWWELPVA